MESGTLMERRLVEVLSAGDETATFWHAQRFVGLLFLGFCFLAVSACLFLPLYPMCSSLCMCVSWIILT